MTLIYPEKSFDVTNCMTAVYHVEVLTSDIGLYLALKEVVHGMVCLSESQWALYVYDIICV